MAGETSSGLRCGPELGVPGVSMKRSRKIELSVPEGTFPHSRCVEGRSRSVDGKAVEMWKTVPEVSSHGRVCRCVFGRDRNCAPSRSAAGEWVKLCISGAPRGHCLDTSGTANTAKNVGLTDVTDARQMWPRAGALPALRGADVKRIPSRRA